jgi:hypothetical protein
MLPSATEKFHRKTYESFKNVTLSRSVRSSAEPRGGAVGGDAVLLKESKA